jgi:ferrous iron transport protein B
VEDDEIEKARSRSFRRKSSLTKTTFKNETFGTDFEAIVADARYKYISAYLAPAETKRIRKASEKMTPVGQDRPGHDQQMGGLAAIRRRSLPDLPFRLRRGSALPERDGGGGFHLPRGRALRRAFLERRHFFARRVPAVPFDGLHGLADGGDADGHEQRRGGRMVDRLGLRWRDGRPLRRLEFFPQIALLFFFFSILEDSGYMARIAFILDKIFRKYGFSGRAFLPMIMGFGCSVPAMMNTRTLATDNERTSTIRVIPFFSCGAKLPIILAVAGCVAELFGFAHPELITLGCISSGGRRSRSACF